MTSTAGFYPIQATATCSALTRNASDLSRSDAHWPLGISADCGNLFKMGERELNSAISLEAAGRSSDAIKKEKTTRPVYATK